MNNNESNKTRLFLSIGAILTIISTLILAGVIGKGVYDYIQSKNKDGKISVSNVNPQYTQDLTSQLVYTGTSTGSEQYYSASIDSIFTLNRGIFNVIEGTNQISIYPKGSTDISFYNYIVVADYTTDYITTYKAAIKNLYPDLKIDEEGKVENLDYFKISYTKTDYFATPVAKTLVHEMIIYRVIDKKVVVARTLYPTVFNINQYSSDLAKLINTIQLSPKNIGTTATVQIKNADMQLSYDRKKFDLSSNSDYNAFLAYRSSDNETNAKYKYLTQTFSIDTSGIVSSSTVLETLKGYRDFDQSLYKDKNFTIVKDNYQLLINGVTFTASDYKYDGFSTTQLVTIAVGKAPYSSNYDVIKITTTQTGSNGYKDTMALINGITFKDLSTTQSTVYPATNTDSNKVLGTSSVDIDKSAIIGKPGVVHIYTKACIDATFKASAALPNTSGKKYTYCYGLLGSGFFVTPNGYIVTNGHVAIPNPLDLLADDLTQSSQLSQYWHDVILDGLAALKAQGYNTANATDAQLITIGLGYTKSLMDNGVLTLTPTYQNYIEGSTPFNIDTATFNVSNGTLVKFVDGQVDSSTLISLAALENKPTGITHPDVAILKMDGSNFPALTLADANLITSGEKIQVIGFPGSANNSSLFGTDTSRIATITNGSISAIKSNTNGTFKLIQIDASISHGNSGGPILDSEGQVVGIATYKINGDESADFNAGVSVQEVTNLLKKNNISPTTSTTSTDISKGLENFSKSYYKLAVTNFSDAVKLYPPTADVLNPMISIAQEKITQGQDQTPVINTIAIEDFLSNYGIHLSGYSTLILLVAIAIFVIFGAITITAVVINRKKMLSQKAPIIGNADLSVVNAQIRNTTDYTTVKDTVSTPDVPMNDINSMGLPTNPLANQQMSTSGLPTSALVDQQGSVTPVQETMPVATPTPVEQTPVQPQTTPQASVPISLTSSYNPLPTTPQPTMPSTDTAPTPTMPETPSTPVTQL